MMKKIIIVLICLTVGIVSSQQLLSNEIQSNAESLINDGNLITEGNGTEQILANMPLVTTMMRELEQTSSQILEELNKLSSILKLRYNSSNNSTR